jgi:hypothetical protein
MWVPGEMAKNGSPESILVTTTDHRTAMRAVVIGQALENAKRTAMGAYEREEANWLGVILNRVHPGAIVAQEVPIPEFNEFKRREWRFLRRLAVDRRPRFPERKQFGQR